MVRSVYFAIPGDLDSQTGGYAYARQVLRELPKHGWAPTVIALDGSFPNPSQQALNEAKSTLTKLSLDTPLLVDGLAYGALPSMLLEAVQCPIAALVHHPLALETGVSASDAKRLQQLERTALSLAQAIIATSRHTANILQSDYAVRADQLTVAEPGIEPADHNDPTGDVPLILAVGTVTRRKAPTHLIEAMGKLKDRAWRVVWCGDTSRDPAYLEEVQVALKSSGLEDRFSFVGILPSDELAELYGSAYLFALPARYEGFGMAFAEAIRRGLPVVGYKAGAVADTVGKGGQLVADGDTNSLSGALARLLNDQSMRNNLAEAAWQRGTGFITWSETAGLIAQALDRIAAR